MQRPVLEFSDYESIPKAIETYILSRSDAHHITEIPLEQINIGIRAEMNHIKRLLGY
jgi:hypothetical protein